MNIIILTGNEIRHQYFRKKMALDTRLNILATYCEGVEQSLSNRVANNSSANLIEKQHVDARTHAEEDFFGASISSMSDFSKAELLAKGEINSDKIVDEIIALNADILVCYGSSLIKSSLLQAYKGRFLNVHLGLSPYYRGSGTNVWPLINMEPDMVGATFMYIDEGIDTGQIIHQIRADIFLGDSPHSIGNRLIKKMTDTYCDITARFNNLTNEEQPKSNGKLYLQKDFDEHACEKLYENFNMGMVKNYIDTAEPSPLPYIVNNKGLMSS